MAWEDLNNEQLEAVASGRVPPALSPHFPFDFIAMFLGRESKTLSDLWDHWPQHRCALVEHWCVLATEAPWAWTECDALFRRLARRGEDIPGPLRRLCTRPRRRGRSRTLARDLMIDLVAGLLEGLGFSRKDAELAIALYLSPDRGERVLDESTVRHARTRAQEFLAKVESEKPKRNS